MGLESSRLRLRVQVISAGVWVTYLLAIALAVWLAATWNRPHRAFITALVVLALVGAFVARGSRPSRSSAAATAKPSS